MPVPLRDYVLYAGYMRVFSQTEDVRETGEGIYGRMQVDLCLHSNLLIKFSIQRLENGLQPQSSLLLRARGLKL